MPAEVAVVAISMKLADDFHSSINLSHIFSLIILGDLDVNISICNEPTPLVEFKQLPVYTLKKLLHDEAVYYSKNYGQQTNWDYYHIQVTPKSLRKQLSTADL